MKKKVIAALFAMFIGGITASAQDPMVEKRIPTVSPLYLSGGKHRKGQYRKMAGYEIRYVYSLGNIQPVGYSGVLVHLSGSIQILYGETGRNELF